MANPTKPTTFDFTGKTILITGGASGIGFQMAKCFAQAKANLVLWDYSKEALQVALSELKQFEGKVAGTAVDVTKRDSILAAVNELKSPIDVLVNNAGITRDKSFSKMLPEDWDAVIQTNLTGLFNVTKGLLDKFQPQSANNRIINISSVVGLYGNFGQVNYASAKAGVIGMTKTLAKEMGRKGFTVNAIAPGFIKTPMTAAMPDDVLKKMAEKVPVKRLGEPDDIAHAALFLATPEASYINGAVLSVDGGIVL